MNAARLYYFFNSMFATIIVPKFRNVFHPPIVKKRKKLHLYEYLK